MDYEARRQGRPSIAWIPVLLSDDLRPEDRPPDMPPLTAMRLDTFGIASDHQDHGVPVPEAGGAVIDAEIAELVALLNRAGIRTMQSCQDTRHNAELGPHAVGWAEDQEEDEKYFFLEDAGEAGRYGIVVVEWDEFPKVGRMLPPWVDSRYIESRYSGWLFSASSDARYVSILFPWHDLAAFTEAVRAAASARDGS